jgi:S1-C subfamily serine protease
MTDDTSPDFLSQFSDALAGLVASAGRLAAAIEPAPGRYLTGILWQADVIVTSEQALPARESYPVLVDGQHATAARLAGRDRGTNVAALRLAAPAAGFSVLPLAAAIPRTGALAVALGALPAPLARLAMIRAVGPAWHSMAGGRIDRLIRLDLRASRAEEGGPVIDAKGDIIGMATAGPRGRALVIPQETIARVLGPLLAEGRVARGWLGVGLQPVAIPDALRAVAGQDAGLMVVSLATSGPAEQAGVLPGDILLSIDGRSLDRRRAIRTALADGLPGRTVEIGVLRAGARLTIQAMIGARPEE